MPPSNGTTQRTIQQQMVELQTLWQQAGAGQGLTTAGAGPTLTAHQAIRQQFDNLQTLWNQPGGAGAQRLTTASAGPTPPPASGDATTALIDKLKQGRGNGGN